VKKNTEITGSRQDKVLEDFIIDNY
jgi:hypothetical protein